jgi:exopolysaccharide production protein ExoZ
MSALAAADRSLNPNRTNVSRTGHAPARLPSLQVLRFLAAFLVVLYHVGSGLQVEYGDSVDFLRFGSMGVHIFFVVSGFIIAYTSTDTLSVPDFLLRRAARIVPVYWLFSAGIIVLLLLSPKMLNSTTLTWEAVWKSFLFIPFQNENGAVKPLLFLGWTLMYEVMFYLLFALSLVAGRARHLAVCGGLLMLYLAGRIWPEGSTAWVFYTNSVILEFAFGVVLCRWFIRHPQIRIWPGFLSCLLIALGAIGCVVFEKSAGWIGQGLPATLIVCGFLYLRLPEGRLLQILVGLGDASYSLYLCHPYLIQLPIKLFGKSGNMYLFWFSILAGVCSSIVVSVLVYRYFELPAQRAVIRSFRTLRSSIGPRASASPGVSPISS